jgi:hypothetical protein
MTKLPWIPTVCLTMRRFLPQVEQHRWDGRTTGIRWQLPSAGRLAAPFDRPRIFKSSHVTPCERSQTGHRGRRATGNREENVSVDRRCNEEEDH